MQYFSDLFLFRPMLKRFTKRLRKQNMKSSQLCMFNACFMSPLIFLAWANSMSFVAGMLVLLRMFTAISATVLGDESSSSYDLPFLYGTAVMIANKLGYQLGSSLAIANASCGIIIYNKFTKKLFLTHSNTSSYFALVYSILCLWFCWF